MPKTKKVIATSSTKAITKPVVIPKDIDMVFSFDTTGSMNQCIRQVRRDVEHTIKTLLEKIPGIRIGVIAHGDYCDEGSTYVTRTCDLTRDLATLTDFIKNKATDTGGGDFPECYELCLRDVQSFEWKDSSIKRLVMIGDAIPHEKTGNPFSIDWKEEAHKLKDSNISVYSVHCMNNKDSKKFFTNLASITSGLYMQLCNFDSIVSFISAICYKQHSDEQLQQYEQEITDNGQMTREVKNMINIISGKVPETVVTDTDLYTVPAGRFQVCPVGDTKIAIKAFVLEQRLPFKVGRGFYEMTKKEKVSDKKEIVLRAKNGDFFSGDHAKELAKEVIAHGDPDLLEDYKVFIQSTSANRVLMPNTLFLYEMVTL